MCVAKRIIPIFYFKRVLCYQRTVTFTKARYPNHYNKESTSYFDFEVNLTINHNSGSWHGLCAFKIGV